MTGAAKIGDVGHGYCYAGHVDVEKGKPKEMHTTIVTGSNDVFINGVAVALLGSVGTTDCGHFTQATSVSSSVIVNGVGMHRLGDSGIVTDDGSGNYDMISGSSDVIIGD